MSIGGKVSPYNFAPSFEAKLVTMMCVRPKLFARFSELDPAGLGREEARRALEAARAIEKDVGRGPDDVSLVLQRLRRWMNEGRVTLDEIQETADMFDAVEDAGLPAEDLVVAEAAPVLKRRIEKEALDEAMQEYGKKGGDVAKALVRLAKAQRVGEQEVSVGALLGPASFDQMHALSKVRRLKTGIMELDDGLSGGPMRGTLSVWVAPSGGGKSMGLVQCATAAARQGFHVGYATLELPEPIINSRLIANLTGVPIDEIIADPYGCGAMEALDQYQAEAGFGRVAVREFTPKVTTVADLIAWADQSEQEWGQRMDVLVVDYGDKLKARGLSDRAQENTYQAQGSVYDEMFISARDTKRWLWTASQTQRKDPNAKKGKVSKADDISDSIAKIRHSDLVITVNSAEDMVTFFIAKNRLGKGEFSVGPLPIDYYCARLAPPTDGVLLGTR